MLELIKDKKDKQKNALRLEELRKKKNRKLR